MHTLSTGRSDFYIIVFYVPSEHAETVKQAMFDQGAGKIGNYDSCCWQVEGQGQFRPLTGSQPAIGTQHQLEKLAESRIEMTCEKQRLRATLDAMIAAHPYEEPAHHYWLVNTGEH